MQNLTIQSTAPERAVIKISYKVIGRNDVTGPMTSKSHTFQDHHRDVLSRLQSETSPARAGRFLFFFGIFRTVFFRSLTVSFLSFFFLEWKVSVSFSCLTAFFVLSRAWAYLFCNDWPLEFPSRFPSSRDVIPLEKCKCTSDDCRVISWSHVQFDEMKVQHWRSHVRTQVTDGRLQICFRSGSAAGGQQARSSSMPTLADAKLESTLVNENNKKLRYLLSDLNSRIRLPFLTRQKPPRALPLCLNANDHSTSTVRLDSKFSTATLTSRTETIRR